MQQWKFAKLCVVLALFWLMWAAPLSNPLEKRLTYI